MRVGKSRLSGKIHLPPSKSHTMRSLILAAHAKGTSIIDNPLQSPDTLAMIQALQQLGVEVSGTSQLTVQGGLKEPQGVIDVGNSGIAYRFVTALAATSSKSVKITGDHSIQTRRVIKPLLSAVQQLGGEASVEDGVVTVKGPIRSGSAELEGADSQPISALLLTAPFLEGETSLKVQNPGERPWIDLTLHWLEKLEIAVEHQEYGHYKIQGGMTLDPFKTTIPADWSAAAFPIVAALVTKSPIQIEGLDLQDPQGDRTITQLLKPYCIGNLFIAPAPHWGGFVDCEGCIDALPVLAVLGCFGKAPLHLVNAAIARKKESDRLHAITIELRKMGANVLEFDDHLTIYPTALHAAELDSHADHRIAMALAVAAMGAEGTSTIHGASCIKKSFPHFIESFQQLGADIS